MLSQSPFLTLPPELRNNIYEYVACGDHAFEILRTARDFTSGAGITSRHGAGLIRTCRQTRDEYNSLLRELMLKPGSKTTAQIHGMDFSNLSCFVTSLTPEEVRLVNKNQTLVAQLFVYDIGEQQAKLLKDWLDVCTKTGIQISYTLHWTSFSLADFRCLKDVLEGHVESSKIWRALGAPSVSVTMFRLLGQVV